MNSSPIMVLGELSAAHARAVRKALATTGNDGMDVIVESPGGRLALALHIARDLTAAGRHVRTHAFSRLGSAAIAVFAAGASRTCRAETEFRFHPVRRELSGWFGSSQLARVALRMERDETDYATFLAARTGRNASFWRRMMRRSSTIVGADAVKTGLATELVERESVFDGDRAVEAEPCQGSGTTSGWTIRFRRIDKETTP